MSECVPSILILGHFFVRRLRDDLDAHFDLCAAQRGEGKGRYINVT